MRSGLPGWRKPSETPTCRGRHRVRPARPPHFIPAGQAECRRGRVDGPGLTTRRAGRMVRGADGARGGWCGRGRGGRVNWAISWRAVAGMHRLGSAKDRWLLFRVCEAAEGPGISGRPTQVTELYRLPLLIAAVVSLPARLSGGDTAVPPRAPAPGRSSSGEPSGRADIRWNLLACRAEFRRQEGGPWRGQ
jgi:hypothetical protein